MFFRIAKAAAPWQLWSREHIKGGGHKNGQKIAARSGEYSWSMRKRSDLLP